ncbi:phosphohistidine phosphatase SixA [Thermodesulfobacteriota bacterium]
MRVYLMRHGVPVSKQENPEKPLSQEGVNGVEKVAGFLQKCGISIEQVLHSGKTRARQTAEIVSSRLNPGKEPLERRGLSPLDDVIEIKDWIQGEEKDLLIAGHLPHLATLASLLLVGNEFPAITRFEPASIVCLEKGAGGEWAIIWMLKPEILQ